jgi:hypothetical protein
MVPNEPCEACPENWSTRKGGQRGKLVNAEKWSMRKGGQRKTGQRGKVVNGKVVNAERWSTENWSTRIFSHFYIENIQKCLAS